MSPWPSRAPWRQVLLPLLVVPAVLLVAGEQRHSPECRAQSTEDTDKRALAEDADDAVLLAHQHHISIGTRNVGVKSGVEREIKGAELRARGPEKSGLNTTDEARWWERLDPKRTAAQASGVNQNSDSDFQAFRTALLTNILLIVAFCSLFMLLKYWFPMVYQNNIIQGTSPCTPPEGLFGWARASLATSNEEAEACVGLDNAMLLEFSNLAMRISFRIGAPLVAVLGTLHWTAGGHAAGNDRMSIMSFGNVQDGNWLYWLHPAFVWYVVIAVQLSIFQAQRGFLPRRFRWLRGMPEPRASTVLVESVPPDYQSDDQLRAFFEKMFGTEDKIKSAFMVKHTEHIEAAIARRRYSETKLLETTTAWERAGRDESRRPVVHTPWSQDAIRYYEKERVDAEEAIKAERKKVEDESTEVGQINTSTGFVTFHARSDAEVAIFLDYTSDAEEWIVSQPPGPDSVRWQDLKVDPANATAQTVFGYGLIALLYMAYLPAVVGISRLAERAHAGIGLVDTLWNAFAPTVGLQLMVAFLPTFLILIFKEFFCLKDETWAQYKLHNYYYWFNIVFVVLVTAIGRSVLDFTWDLIAHPLNAFAIFAETMPYSTHFYINFMVLQWVSHFMNILRYVNLFKFVALQRLFNDEDARKMAEPEDQDFYGIGSRSARWTTNLIIGIVFSTLSPPIAVVTFINFAIARLVYGYLIPFAETRKADLGGACWVQCLHHLFIGLGIYVVLMTGVLWRQAGSHGPALMAAPALLYVLLAYRRFNTEFKWERLPFSELVREEQEDFKGHVKDGTKYVQPGLVEMGFGDRGKARFKAGISAVMTAQNMKKSSTAKPDMKA